MDSDNNNSNIMPIPGLEYFYSKPASSFPRGVILVVGPTGSGKTVYCTQFVQNGLAQRDPCVYVSLGQAISVDRLAPKPVKGDDKHDTPAILNFSFSGGGSQESLFRDLMEKISRQLPAQVQGQGTPREVRLVIDSLSQLIARFSLDPVQRFVIELYDLLKARGDVMALFTLTGNPSFPAVDILGSLVDGMIQLRFEENMDDNSDSNRSRGIRFLSHKSVPVSSKWVAFQIGNDSTIKFGNEISASTSAPVRCRLCHEPIIGEVAGTESDSPYHKSCFMTHKKLGEVYGLNVGYGLEPGVANANFFFIDIVGLSDPSLSVEKQIKKIQELNSTIKSCEAFKNSSRTDKIVLPTGDGMAIGFLINPELPLQLSMQLHQKLTEFNAKVPADEAIGVRIGLSSGPVFVVSDINNNQNVWGPGIILARRVMDLGDSGHILLSENIAEVLRNLKDEYKSIIRQVGSEHKIKHGQSLKLYSAYSRNFGNPAVPSKVAVYP